MRKILLFLWITFAFLGSAWAVDADDKEGKQGPDTKQQPKEIVITTPEGEKMYLDYQAGTWRDDKGHRGSLDTR